jgi:hypothetical protein
VTAVVADRPEALAVQSPAWQDIRELTLAALPSAVPCARLLVQHALSDWQLDHQLIDVTDALVGELVGHAIVSTGIVDPLPSYDDAFDHLTLLDLRLQWTPERLLIAVRDTGWSAPNVHRDLHQVLTHSEEWGWYRPKQGGRVIWCSLRTAPSASSLPRRIRGAVPSQADEPPEPVRDVDVLQRVLDGLQTLDHPHEQEE